MGKYKGMLRAHTCATDDFSQVVLSELVGDPKRNVLVYWREFGERLELGGDVSIFELPEEALICAPEQAAQRKISGHCFPRGRLPNKVVRLCGGMITSCPNTPQSCANVFSLGRHALVTRTRV